MKWSAGEYLKVALVAILAILLFNLVAPKVPGLSKLAGKG